LRAQATLPKSAEVRVSGRVTEFRPDDNLAFIDRMSHKYLGTDYERRTPREVVLISVDRVSHSGAWG
jgi:hypothetical protein